MENGRKFLKNTPFDVSALEVKISHRGGKKRKARG